MSSDRRVTCRVCGRHESVCGQISWRGKCIECAERLQAENIAGMGLKVGYPLARWRRAMARAVGGMVLDDRREVAAAIGAVLLDDLPANVRAALVTLPPLDSANATRSHLAA